MIFLVVLTELSRSLELFLSMLETGVVTEEDLLSFKLGLSREFLSQEKSFFLSEEGWVLGEEGVVPEVVVVASSEGCGLATQLQGHHRELAVLAAPSLADLRSSMACLVSRIQKFCNCNSRAPPVIRMLILGSDSFLNGVLRLYVEQFSVKPQEWQGYLRFYIVPLSGGGGCSVVKYLSRADSQYSALFGEPGWRELLAGQDGLEEAAGRVLAYLGAASHSLQLPIAQAMVAYRSRSGEEESTQVLIPFVSDVKVGTWDATAASSVDLEEQPGCLLPPAGSGGSPPGTGGVMLDKVSPPSSPSLPPQPLAAVGELLDLQVDYWFSPSRHHHAPPSSASSGGDKAPPAGEKGSKFSLKTNFRSLQVSRLPSPAEICSSTLTFNYITKEKKQKIIRLGKRKEREVESRYQTLEGINRLVCLSKNPPIKVHIDGVEWTGVKFFQLAPQWQTHIKYFPVAVFNDQASV